MNAVVVFARAPSARGKTRLTAGLASHHARALREALFLDTVDAVRDVLPEARRYSFHPPALDRAASPANPAPSQPGGPA